MVLNQQLERFIFKPNVIFATEMLSIVWVIRVSDHHVKGAGPDGQHHLPAGDGGQVRGHPRPLLHRELHGAGPQHAPGGILYKPETVVK